MRPGKLAALLTLALETLAPFLGQASGNNLLYFLAGLIGGLALSLVWR